MNILWEYLAPAGGILGLFFFQDKIIRNDALFPLKIIFYARGALIYSCLAIVLFTTNNNWGIFFWVLLLALVNLISSLRDRTYNTRPYRPYIKALLISLPFCGLMLSNFIASRLTNRPIVFGQIASLILAVWSGIWWLKCLIAIIIYRKVGG